MWFSNVTHGALGNLRRGSGAAPGGRGWSPTSPWLEGLPFQLSYMTEFLRNKVKMISCEEKVSLPGKTPEIEIEHICQRDNDNLMFASSKMQKKKKKKCLKLPILKLAGKMCETWLLKPERKQPEDAGITPFPAGWCRFAFF